MGTTQRTATPVADRSDAYPFMDADAKQMSSSFFFDADACFVDPDVSEPDAFVTVSGIDN